MEHLKEKILELAQNDLDEIEVALKKNLNPELEIVSEVAGHILFAGGKRIRPLIMTLSSKICGYFGDYDKIFSTIFEYLHTATLLHDDLVDDADLRRGKPTAHSIWGNSAAVLAGDFLLARSLSIAAKTGNCDVISVIANITEDMSRGEIHQLTRKKALDISEAEYMKIIERKTAVLFRGACRVSAILAEAPPEKKKAVSDFGYNLGIAFQMADDLLDYTCDAETLGKNPGADLREGKVTLPVIHAMESSPIKERRLIEKIITQKTFSYDEFNTLTNLLRAGHGISYTRGMAEKYAAKAKEALSVFEKSQAKKILLMIVKYVLERI